MAGGDPADAVSPTDREQGKSQRVYEIPDDKLTVRHLRRARDGRGSEEDRETPPASVGPLPLREDLLPVGLMLPGPLNELPSPSGSDLVAREASDLAGDGDDDHGSCDGQLSVAGCDASRSGGQRTDERHSGPGGGD